MLISIYTLLRGKDNKNNLIFFIFCIICTIWILCNVFANISKGEEMALFFTQTSIIFVSIIPIIFLILIKNLFYQSNVLYIKKFKHIIILSIIFTIFICIFAYTPLNIESIKLHPWGVEYDPGLLYNALLIYFLVSFGFSTFTLYKVSKYGPTSVRRQSRLILKGSVITIILCILFDIIFPIFNYSFFSPLAPITIIFFLGYTCIAIYKYKLFNIRIIFIEVIFLFLIIFIFLRILLSDNDINMYSESSLLIIILMFGVIIIRNITHKIKQEEKIEELTKLLLIKYSEVKELENRIEIMQEE